MLSKEGEKDMDKLTLFLVDNYLLDRITNRKRFDNNKNYKVLGDFHNAQDCLCALQNVQPDVIITDLDLSNMNGIEFCKIVKEKYPKIKVVILTSFTDDSKILASISSGASAYVLKGYKNPEEVIDIVANGGFWLDNELAQSVFSKIPMPDIKNLENLYKYEDVKYSLTKRELEVLKLMIEGKTNSQIADEIFVSINTIKAHVGSILEKFGAVDRVQASVMAIRANIF